MLAFLQQKEQVTSGFAMPQGGELPQDAVSLDLAQSESDVSMTQHQPGLIEFQAQDQMASPVNYNKHLNKN